jgi:hypothetical protein
LVPLVLPWEAGPEPPQVAPPGGALHCWAPPPAPEEGRPEMSRTAVPVPAGAGVLCWAWAAEVSSRAAQIRIRKE